MKRFLCLLTGMLFFFSIVLSQNKQTIVTGVVTDSLQKPLSYVTISFFKQGQLTGEPVKRTYTNEKGNYNLLIDTGYYMLVAAHTAFSEVRTTVHIRSDENTIAAIKLTSTAHTLQEVTVVSKKSLVEQSDDKITYNAELDPAAKAESASDILRKTPLVTVDGDGNVQLNGQSSFKILLNGRETAMFAQNLKDALKNFPGALITKIEVITSPSAKYDAEGTGGVINIVTKKKLVGYNGYVSNYYSTLSNYNQSLSINVKTGKLGISAYMGHSGSLNDIPGSSASVTTALTPAVFTKRSLSGSVRNNNYGAFSNLEITYDIDSFNVFNLYGNLNRTRSLSDIDQAIATEFISQPFTNSIYQQENRYINPSSGIGMDYIRKYRGQPDKEFSARFNSQFSNNDGTNQSTQDNPGQDRFIFNKSEAGNREYTLQGDLVLPLPKNAKFETGIKGILRKASSDFASLVKYNSGDPYLPNPSNTDNFNYHQEVFGAYVSANKTFHSYSLRLGLRMEHTAILGDFSTSKTKVEQRYTNLIPNFLISKKIGPFYTLTFSYNMRLQRPYITNLNPFINNNDSLNISFGNPSLGPQTIHTLSLQNRYIRGKFFAAITFNGSYTGDMIVQYASFNKATGVTSNTSANAGKEFQLSIAANMNTPIGEKFTLGLNAVLRHNTINNQLILAQRNNGISGNLFGNFNYKVIGKFTISGSGGFMRGPYALLNSPGVQVFYQVNFGCRFFHDKLAATMNVNNFLNKNFTLDRKTEDPNFSVVNMTTFPYRVIYFGMTYNFGKLKEAVSKKKGVSNDDLL